MLLMLKSEGNYILIGSFNASDHNVGGIIFILHRIVCMGYNNASDVKIGGNYILIGFI